MSIEDGVGGRFRNLKRNLADELALEYSNLHTSWTCDRDRESKISMVVMKRGGQVQLSRGILASFAQGGPPVQWSDRGTSGLQHQNIVNHHFESLHPLASENGGYRTYP